MEGIVPLHKQGHHVGDLKLAGLGADVPGEPAGLPLGAGQYFPAHH